ncbi:glutamic acid-rich protein [Drosophila pseudoobscura]|uniref:Glutamic acid-rich protein n=1 Tax=Drosophila pseudoobscura pseudoobscura TaxID=46245 RepID=A0A6I8UMA2_DROPS|nr:glutamic acid-rich protein [Drosophila pseudoobscura]
MEEAANGTPQSARRPRLGLMRRACHTTPLLRLQREELGTTTPTDRTEQETPRALPLSTNSRKRIGLSRIRTELTKKRLEFAAASQLKEKTSEKESTPREKEKKPQAKKAERTVASKLQEDERGKIVEDKDRLEEDDERAKIVEDKEQMEEEDEEVVDKEQMEEEDDKVEPQDSRIAELQADIETWRRGFIATMNDLQAMVDPRPTKKAVLIQLGIPLEMLRYLEED